MRVIPGLSAALALLLAGPVQAAPGDLLSGQLDLQIGILASATLDAVPGATGSSAGGPGSAATLAPGAFSGTFVSTLTRPLLGLLGTLHVAGSGATFPAGLGSPGATPPLVATGLFYDGLTGSMALGGSAFLGNPDLTSPLPLGVVGVDARAFKPFLGAIAVASVEGALYTNPSGVVTGWYHVDDRTGTLSASGFDARTPGGGGTLQLVSPSLVTIGTIATFPVFSTLTLEFETVPEPGSLLMMVAGALALARMTLR